MYAKPWHTDLIVMLWADFQSPEVQQHVMLRALLTSCAVLCHALCCVCGLQTARSPCQWSSSQQPAAMRHTQTLYAGEAVVGVGMGVV